MGGGAGRDIDVVMVDRACGSCIRSRVHSLARMTELDPIDAWLSSRSLGVHVIIRFPSYAVAYKSTHARATRTSAVSLSVSIT